MAESRPMRGLCVCRTRFGRLQKAQLAMCDGKFWSFSEKKIANSENCCIFAPEPFIVHAMVVNITSIVITKSCARSLACARCVTQFIVCYVNSHHMDKLLLDYCRITAESQAVLNRGSVLKF